MKGVVFKVSLEATKTEQKLGEKFLSACLHYRTVLKRFPRNHSGSIQNSSDARLHCPKQIGRSRSFLMNNQHIAKHASSNENTPTQLAQFIDHTLLS